MSKFELIEKNLTKTRVMDWNAEYFGISIYEWMDRAGFGIAKAINSKFNPHSVSPLEKGRKKRGLEIGIFCGLGNNGGDGFAAGKYLYEDHDVTIFLFGREEDIKTEESRRTWGELKEQKVPYIILEEQRSDRISKKLDSIASLQNDKWDVVVDAFLGTGVKGKLREPIASGVDVYNKLSNPASPRLRRTQKVSVDFPTKGVQMADLIVSMQFPKTLDAVTVDLMRPLPQSLPTEGEGKKSGGVSPSGGGEEGSFLSKIGPGELKAIEFPGPDSHKGDAGHLLVISGFEEYHGALLYSVQTASKVADIIYVYTSEENKPRVEKLKDKTAEFVAIDDLSEAFNKVNTVLIGPGLGRTELAYSLVDKILTTDKKVVFDADALSIMDAPLKDKLNEKHILTPHKKEFERLFAVKATEENVQKMMKKYKCAIVLKGKTDIVASPDWGVKYNYTGNEGMTKGGTGDVLAGLIAGLYCITDDPYLAAGAGVFVNGLAGDEMYESVGRFYDVEELVEQVPRVLHRFSQNY